VSIDPQRLPPPPLPRSTQPPQVFPSPLPGVLALPPAATGRVFLLGIFTHTGVWPSADQSFTHPGGVLVVGWNTSAFVSVANSAITGQLVLDGVVVDSNTYFVNLANVHTPFPQKWAVFAASQLNIPGAQSPVATGVHKHHLALTGTNGTSNGSDLGFTIVLALQP